MCEGKGGVVAIPSWLIWTVAAIPAGLLVSRVILPWALGRRGVVTERSMFGQALVFDGQDEQGKTVRYLNVNGVFQSVAYVDEELRDELACTYHQYFAEAIKLRFPWLDDAPSTPASSASDGNSTTAGAADGAPASAVITPADTGTDGSASAPASASASTSASTTPATGKRVRPLRALVIGGGGFVFPSYLASRFPDMQVDAVEIDPVIIRLAREHFGLDQACAAHPNLQVMCTDGWDFLRNGGAWDIIVNDAFSGSQPLGSLGTADGARIIHEHLSADGLYLANVRTALEGPKSQPLHELTRVFQAEFQHVKVFAEHPDQPEKIAYNALVACDSLR